MFEDYQNLMQEAEALQKSSINPYFSSKYANLNDVLAQVKKLCLKNNFIFLQYPTSLNDKNYLKTELIHKDGAKTESLMELVCKDNSDPQKLGSALTYMRRYSLVSIFGLEQDDDDGNKASLQKPKQENNGSSTNCKKCGSPSPAGALAAWGMCKKCKTQGEK